MLLSCDMLFVFIYKFSSMNIPCCHPFHNQPLSPKIPQRKKKKGKERKAIPPCKFYNGFRQVLTLYLRNFICEFGWRTRKILHCEDSIYLVNGICSYCMALSSIFRVIRWHHQSFCSDL